MEEKITLERALTLIRESVQPVASEQVPVEEAYGRILTEDILAPMDQPPFPRSPLDGYSFHAEDSKGASKTTPVTLQVVETIYAGGKPERTIQRGEGARIMTGAPIPPGCNCVIRQEETDRGKTQVQLYRELSPWENYCYQGEDYRQGDVLLSAGTCLDAAAMGILASAGLCRKGTKVSVHRPIRGAIVCSGDELCSNEVQPLPLGKIYSSNEAYLSSRFADFGITLTGGSKKVPDQPEQAAEMLRNLANEVDVIITTGGVSVGEKDIFHQVLPLLGAKRLFWRVLIKPGTPLMYSLYQGTPILSLSGNPFAATATFELLGRPLLAALTGNDGLQLKKTRGTLENRFPKSSGVRRFLRGRFLDGRVLIPDTHASGQIRSMAGGNCLVELEDGRGPAEAGEAVTVYLL